MQPSLKPSEARGILTKLRDGTPPVKFTSHLAVGRRCHLDSVGEDLHRVSLGEGRVRFIVAEYGMGKSFFLAACRSLAHQHNFIVMNSQFSNDKMLAGAGKTKCLYRDLLLSMSSSAQPKSALRLVLEKFASKVHAQTKKPKVQPSEAILQEYASIAAIPYGNSALRVIQKFLEGWEHKDKELQTAALRWFLGDINSSDSSRLLRVKEVIDDRAFLDALRVVGALCKEVGYAGLMVQLDELHHIHGLQSSMARNVNYSTINDYYNTLSAEHENGFHLLFGCTERALSDNKAGLYSNASLASRVKPGSYDTTGNAGALLRLHALKEEDYLELLAKIDHIYCVAHSLEKLTTQDDLANFIKFKFSSLGGHQGISMRDTIKDFLSILPRVAAGETMEDIISHGLSRKSQSHGSSSSRSVASSRDLEDLA